MNMIRLHACHTTCSSYLLIDLLYCYYQFFTLHCICTLIYGFAALFTKELESVPQCRLLLTVYLTIQKEVHGVVCQFYAAGKWQKNIKPSQPTGRCDMPKAESSHLHLFHHSAQVQLAEPWAQDDPRPDRVCLTCLHCSQCENVLRDCHIPLRSPWLLLYNKTAIMDHKYILPHFLTH